MYERQHTPPLNMGRFLKRMALHGCAALAVIAVSLVIGMFGYRHLGQEMSWLDAFLNAAMILSGMGPVDADKLSDPGKLFAGLYALYSGVVFIAVMGILLAPVVHRVLHRFHWEDEHEDK
jgi:hypothetical protein